jgi:hypothetical protein
MEKVVKIDGGISKKGTTAYKLNVLAAKEGNNLTEYIRKLFNKHVDDNF